MHLTRNNGQRLSCGIAGCGYIADIYMEAFRRLPHVGVAAACDTDAARLSAFCSKYRVARSYASVEELLDSVELSFVVIATPPFTHHALCAAAIERGVPALVEKPLCLSLAEARDLAERAARKGVPVAVMQNYRFKGTVLKAQQLQRSGELGELRRVDCVYHGGAPQLQKEQWRQQERSNRLLLYEWAEHFLDIQVAFAGPVRNIRAVHVTQKPDADSTLAVHALIEHLTGVIGSIDLQLFAGAESVRVELHGSRKRVVLKFYPEGCALYSGRVTPLQEIWAETRRAARYACGLSLDRLIPGRVARRALSHWRFVKKYVGYLQGAESRLPLSLEESLPTLEVLEHLAVAVY